MQNNVQVINQPKLIKSSDSIIFLENIIIKDTLAELNIFSIAESEVYFKNITIFNITSYAGEESDIIYSSNSLVVIQNCTYSQSDSVYLSAVFSTVELKELVISTIVMRQKDLIMIARSIREVISTEGVKHITSIIDSSFTDIMTNTSNALRIRESDFGLVQNTNFDKINGSAVKIESSTVLNLENLNIINAQKWLEVKRSVIVSINGSTFDTWGDYSKTNGGGVNIKDSNTTISSSIFKNNKAINGGGLGITWTITHQWLNVFENLTFSNNSAETQGGAIYYNLNRPVISGLKFENNSAKYGPDIASYAVRIVESGTNSNKVKLNYVASGLLYTEALGFNLVDIDNQIMNLESGNTVKIVAIENNTQVRGTDFSKLVNGKVEFNNIIFKAEAGASNISFRYL